jgi:hypothetical protein
MIATITSFVDKVVSTVKEPIFGVDKPKAKVGKSVRSGKSRKCSGRKSRCN